MAELLDNVLIEGFDPAKWQIEGKTLSDKDWETIYGAYQNNKFLQAQISGIETFGEGEAQKTCALVHVGAIKGMIPMEFTGATNLRQLRAMTGQDIAFMVLNYDREAGIFTGSRIKALNEMARITLRKIEEGDTIPAVVRHVSPNLVRADIGGIEVKIPIQDVRHGWIDDLQEEVQVGTPLKVKVLEIKQKDVEDEKENVKTEVKVSAKATKENPWPDCTKRYQKGGEYVGKVSGVREYGVFVNLEPGVDSLASHLKFQNVKKGDKVLVRVKDIDPKEEQVRTRITRVM